MRGPGGGGGGGDGGLGGGLLHRPMESSWNRDGSAGLSGGGLSGALGAKQAFEQSRIADTLKLEAQGDALLRALGAASKVSDQAGGGGGGGGRGRGGERLESESSRRRQEEVTETIGTYVGSFHDVDYESPCFS